ncbi:MAG: universal stress protein [Thermodesulfobacteriota bacterium]
MVPPTSPGDFSRILFPTDLTEASDAAAEYALTMATHYKARLYVVHTVDTSGEAAGFYLPHISFENLDHEMVVNAEKMLDKYCARFFKGLEECVQEVYLGIPYEEILKAVEDKDIDLVIMGAFARGRLDHFLFGSTTERVMRKIDRPVLVVPPRV